MNKEVYRRLSKAERKLENTNRLRTNNSTLRIKYEGVKKLLEKKEKEIERLNNIINEFEDILKRDIKACNNKFENMFDRNYRRLILEEKLEQLQELKGEIK